MALSTRLLALRRSPILLKLPPYLSALCLIVGVAWLFLLPLDEYSRQTYVSENAILPGQVHTYFGGSEHNVFRAYRQEVWHLSERSDHERTAGLEHEIRSIGLKAATQEYSFRVAGEEIAGTNVYGVLRGPRADATESMVLIAAWRNFEGQINYSGVALALTLARYFHRWSIWSKDIILLIPDDSVYGPEAWVTAFHSTSSLATSTRNISSLPLKAGAIQGVVALDYPAGPWGQRFDQLDILYDGVNGALPNLDLFNTAVSVASSQMGIGCTIHNLLDHADDYFDRMLTLTKGLLTQSLGHATGPHSAFMPYHIDAITLKTVGDGWHDEMSLGRTTESLFRSVNNLLEKLHQSFFFYILLNTNRFVSVGNYLPAAMILAGNFSVAALACWVRSGKSSSTDNTSPSGGKKAFSEKEMEVVKDGDAVALVPKDELKTTERKVFLPAVLVLSVHLAGCIPLFLLTTTHRSRLTYALHASTVLTIALSVFLARYLSRLPIQQIDIMHSFSLVLLGGTLSTLATLNFSLAFLIGLICAPFSFIRPLPSIWLAQSQQQSASKVTAKGPTKSSLNNLVSPWATNIPLILLYTLISPPIVLYILDLRFLHIGLEEVLVQMARAWHAQGSWTGMCIVWGVWWPAWVVGGAVLGSGMLKR